MSLVDALLLEGYRDPREIHVALRTDQLLGAGTASDPLDGGVISDATITATSLTLDRKDVMFATVVPHGYANGSLVDISGVTTGAMFNGTFTITVINNRAFKVTVTSDPQVQHGPFDNIKCKLNGQPDTTALDPRLFWPVAKVSTAANHGYADYEVVSVAGVSNSIFNGQFIALGAANGATVFYYRLTTLPPSTFSQTTSFTCARLIYRFDQVMRSVPANSIVRVGPGTYPTRGSNGLYDSSAVGFKLGEGVRLQGSGIGATVLQLVYAIDYRAGTTAVGNRTGLLSADVGNFSVDCNLPGQQIPAGSAFAMVVCEAVVLFGNEIRVRRVRAIRFGTQGGEECFVLFVFNNSTAISQNPRIEDCIVEQPSVNNARETTLIQVSGDHVRANSGAGVVRHNYVNCELPGGVLPEFIGIAPMPGGLTQPDAQGLFHVVTRRAHHRVVGQNVVIANVLDPATGLPTYFNGSFEIKSQPSATELVCKMLLDPLPAPITPDVSQAYIGVDFHAVNATGGICCVTEGNSMFNATNPFYVDTGTSRSQIQRDNYYSNVLLGAFQNLLSAAGPSAGPLADGVQFPALALSHIGDLATFAAKEAHGLRAGMAVRIQGARISGVPADDTYNGFFTVESVSDPTNPDDKTFSYRMKAVPTADGDAATPASPIRFQPLWQTAYHMIENNVMDLWLTDSGTALAPVGAVTYGFESSPPYAPPPYVFPQWVVRGNIVRHLDGLASTSNMLGQPAGGFSADSVDHALIEQNIIDTEDYGAIRRFVCNGVICFNNRTGAGSLLRCQDRKPGFNPAQFDQELEDRVSDAAVFSI